MSQENMINDLIKNLKLLDNTFEIKICGINDEICMATALQCKVEYIGLVFYENSPRNVTINYSRKLLYKRNKYSKIVALTVEPDDKFIEILIFPVLLKGRFWSVLLNTICGLKLKVWS